VPEDNAARKSFEAGARTAREAMDRGTAAAEQATRQAEKSYSSTAEGIREFNTKLLDIAQANTMAGMNFVSELTRVKGPTEAMELWSRHAQNQLQTLTEQSQELATLCQRIAVSSTEPLTRSFDQTFKRAS
jgi:phasin